MLLHSSDTVVAAIVARLLKTSGPIAVMAGHFSLVHHRQTGELVPGIINDIADEATRSFVAQHHYMSNFPLETWRAGIEIVQRLRSAGRSAKLLLLVNDWQHVESASSGQRNPDRDAFFANPTLPPALRSLLTAADLNDSDLITDIRDGKPCVFWSESSLRARYTRSLKKKVPVQSECAQEWVPLLTRLEELDYHALAAFVPSSCRIPVIGGTERAEECLELKLQTTSIFPGGDRENFWENTWIER